MDRLQTRRLKSPVMTIIRCVIGGHPFANELIVNPAAGNLLCINNTTDRVRPNQVTKNHCSYSFPTHKLKKKHRREEIVTTSHFARCEIRCIISNVRLVRISCNPISNDKKFNLHDNKHLIGILGELREGQEDSR